MKNRSKLRILFVVVVVIFLAGLAFGPVFPTSQPSTPGTTAFNLKVSNLSIGVLAAVNTNITGDIKTMVPVDLTVSVKSVNQYNLTTYLRGVTGSLEVKNAVMASDSLQGASIPLNIASVVNNTSFLGTGEAVVEFTDAGNWSGIFHFNGVLADGTPVSTDVPVTLTGLPIYNSSPFLGGWGASLGFWILDLVVLSVGLVSIFYSRKPDGGHNRNR